MARVNSFVECLSASCSLSHLILKTLSCSNLRHRGEITYQQRKPLFEGRHFGSKAQTLNHETNVMVVVAKLCRALFSRLKNFDFTLYYFTLKSVILDVRTSLGSLLGMQKLESDPGLLHFDKIQRPFVEYSIQFENYTLQCCCVCISGIVEFK